MPLTIEIINYLNVNYYTFFNFHGIVGNIKSLIILYTYLIVTYNYLLFFIYFYILMYFFVDCITKFILYIQF